MNWTDSDNDTSMELSSSNGDSSTNSSQLSIITPGNIIFYESTMERFHNETDFKINDTQFFSTSTDINVAANDSSIYIFKTPQYNETVFSGYPPELLCFGAICFVVFAVIGVLGNFISILALSKCKRLRNATTAFIVNLCVADLMFCSFSMPLSAVMFIQRTWFLGKVLCKLFPLIRYTNGAVSIFSVIAITVNRYVLIVHPKTYLVLYKRRNMALMIFLIWFLSLLLLMLPLLGLWGTLGYDPTVGTCTILKRNETSPKMFIYIAGFGLPSIIFVCCYMRIFFVVRKTSKRASRKVDTRSTVISFSVKRGWFNRSCVHPEMAQSYANNRDRRELRILRLLLVIFILFIVCYFPVSFVKIFHKENDLPILNVFGYLGVYFSNIVNPIIYIVMSKEYRRAYKELFCSSRMKRQTIINKL